VATGNYLSAAYDMQITTPGFPLAVSRTYESSRPIDGLLGIGWTSSLAAHLYYATYLYSAPSTYSHEADVVMPDGARYRYIENNDGTFSPVNRYDTLTHNGDGTWALVLRDNAARLSFDADGRLTTLSDEFGNTLAYTYDGSGRLVHVADSGGSARYLDVYYGANGRLASVQDHTGRTITYDYASNGTLTGTTDAGGRRVGYTYTSVRFAPLLTRIDDPWARTISTITYDSLARTATYTEDGETYTYTYNYDGHSNQSSKIDSVGNRWIYTYGANGFVSQRAFPGGGTQSAVANADGTVAQTTDEVGVVTAYAYDSQAHVSSVIRDVGGPLTVRIDYAYDPSFPGKVIAVTPHNPATGNLDPSWQGWKYDYWPAGSPAPGALYHVWRVESDGATNDLLATYTYDDHGRVTTQVDAAGFSTDYTYTPQGDTATALPPANNDSGVRFARTYSYDALGRVLADGVNDTAGAFLTFSNVYDAADRITSIKRPGVTSPYCVAGAPGTPCLVSTNYVYDRYDSTTGLTFVDVTDPNGNLTSQGYDQFGRLRRSIDALGKATIYGYTRALLTSLTDANGNTTSYQYDAFGRLAATVFPDSAHESYAYFPDNLLSSKTDRKNQSISYQYDHLKRLTRKTYPNGTYIEYTYTGQNLSQVTDTSLTPNETHTFSYDNAFRMTSNTQGTRGTINYSYDARDAVASYAVTGGASASYTYYPNGRLNTITWSNATGQFKYRYVLDGGQTASIDFPNGQQRLFTYDSNNRLSSVDNVHPTAGSLARFQYGYDYDWDAASNIKFDQRTSMTATVPALGLSNALTHYAYDNAYQLKRAEYPGRTDAWTYDSIGNRLTDTTGGVTATYLYQKIGANPNNWQRLTSDGANTYTYDANGNTASRTGLTFGWDSDDRLTSVSGLAVATYRYDYQGRRTSKIVGGVTTTYFYDGLNILGDGSNEYLYGSDVDEPIALKSGATVTYYDVDGLGSVGAVNSSDGATLNVYTYDAWGEPRSVSEATQQPFRYTSREIGDADGTNFYRARFYAANIGRFLSEDPLNHERGGSLYSYGFNEPVTLKDPRGLTPVANYSHLPIPYKPEKCGGAVPCPIKDCKPGETCDVDGIYPPDCKSNPVKIVDYCTAVILPNGWLVIMCPPVINLFQLVKGGPVDNNFMKKHPDWAPPSQASGCQKKACL
jgi:RHS repeat-associated protein